MQIFVMPARLHVLILLHFIYSFKDQVLGKVPSFCEETTAKPSDSTYPERDSASANSCQETQQIQNALSCKIIWIEIPAKTSRSES